MSETAEIKSLVLGAARQPTTIDMPDGRSFVLLPQGDSTYKLEQITLPNKADVLLPKLVTQHVKMQQVGSLCDYVNRFKDTDSVLFADITRDSIEAVIDYHRGAETDRARLAVHRATLALPKSLEWQTWNAASGAMKTHTAFATFLEENSLDVVSPPGADLLELCRDLQVLQNVNFGSTVRMGDVTQVNYQKDNDATSKGGVSLPQSIMLRIPVYFGEPAVSMQAFMRRQIEDGKLKLGIQLSRAENVRQDEFHRIVDAISADVALTTLYGTAG